MTFVMFLYEEIQWGNLETNIGFNAGDQLQAITLAAPLTVEGIPNLVSTSNVGIPGVYIFRVDLTIEVPGKSS